MAKKTLRAALDAGRLAEKRRRATCLEPIALAWIRLGDIDEAIAVAAEIPGARNTELFPKLGEELARRGRYKEAIALADRASPLYGDHGIRAILALQAAKDDWRAAVTEEKRIFGRAARGILDLAVMEALEAGDLRRAKELAAAASDIPWYLSRDIALAEAREGDLASAVRRATSTADSPAGAAMTLARIAAVAAASGESARAAELRALAMELSAKDAGGGHASRRLLFLVDDGRADQALVELRAQPGSSRAFTAGALAETLAEEGRIDEALQAAALVPDVLEEDLHKAYEPIAEAQLRKGDPDGARRSLEMAPLSVRGRLSIFPKVAIALAARDDVPGALALLQGPELSSITSDETIELIAEAQAGCGSAPPRRDWVERLRSPLERARARLGAARGLRLRTAR